MTTEITSLAYYVNRAKKAGVSKEQLISGGDYHEQIPAKIDLDKAINLWNEMYEDALVPLADVSLPQADFSDIADQIYNGVSPIDVKTQLPLPSPPPIQHEPYFPKYQATIPKDTRTPAAVNATIDRVNEVIGKNISNRCNGLVVGRVQSGKTRNYIGLMLKAADEGWNVVIVLTSAIKSLALQTRNRIADEFSDVGATNRSRVCELDFLSSKPKNDLAGEELTGDFLYWGVAMKQVDSLERIKVWLNIPNQPLKSMRVMIIDDEADNATPDSNTRDAGNLEEEEIEERIEAIRTAPGFEELADWFVSLGEREWPDIGAKTPEADTFGKIIALLKDSQSKWTKRDTIVNSAAYRHFLGMDQFTNPPVENLISEFFRRSKGIGDDTCGAFVLLLKSILDIARERSAINSAICALIGENAETGLYTYPFARCAYLGYTATPYANILNESPNHSPIYADFIQSLAIPPQYFGTEAIFGCNLETPESRMPIIQSITDNEEVKILTPLRQNGAIEADDNLFCKFDKEKVEWKSLKDAVAWAFCTAAVRRYSRQKIADAKKREDRDNRWTTMLVNIHHARVAHGVTKAILGNYIKAHCDTPEARTAFMEYCHEVWNAQTQQFTLEHFNALFNGNKETSRNYGDGVKDYPAWDEIKPSLMHFLIDWQQCVHAIVINSTKTGGEEQASYNQYADDIMQHKTKEYPDDHLWIVSGGNTIGRGLTLPGLTVSYFDRVRDTTCVDTLTQMGRWFGYRPGYELLPRVWMNLAAVGEMKRIAILEMKMHDSVASNFIQHFSPKDPAHFQHIDSWRRGITGRNGAVKVQEANFGTISVTNHFFTSADKRQMAYYLSEEFMAKLGPQKKRETNEYLYCKTPLWEKIDRNTVRLYLESILLCYPEESRKILRGIAREINGSDPVEWDVVLGNPNTRETGIFGGQAIHLGAPKSTPVCKDVISTNTAFLNMAFYAMIPSRHIWSEDLVLLDKYRMKVAEAIKQKRILNNGILPKQYDEVLPGDPKDPIEDRLALLVAQFKDSTIVKPLSESIHGRFDDIDISQGYRRRSAGDYMAHVHKSADHARPTLQLYLFRPDGVDDGAAPMISISFYWPGHVPDGFFTVCVDENSDSVRMVTPRVFCQNVEDILKERNLPVQRKELLRLVIERLGLRCNESFFNLHINNPLDGFKYHRMEGCNAYCIDGLEQKLEKEMIQAAITILQRDKTPYATGALIQQVVDEQPKFRDFFSPKSDCTAFNKLMTDEVMGANGIALTSQKPMIYQYQG